MVIHTPTWFVEAVEKEMVEERRCLASFRAMKKELQKVIDVPDRKDGLFIKLVANNEEKLSKKKRGSRFSEVVGIVHAGRSLDRYAKLA